MDLRGKVALITGGGTGIGAGIARRFVRDGAKICISGRRQEMLDKVADSLPGGSVVTCPGDVTKPADAARMVKAILEFAGRLDILVNNAGIDAPGNVLAVALDLWEQVIATNLTAPMLMMRHAIPSMIEAGGGSIINIASLAGVRSLPNMPAYCASKAGLIALTQQVALDFGPSKIRCNVVCPGAISLTSESRPETAADERKAQIDAFLAKLTRYTPLKRPGTIAEIAGVCSFLAGDDSTFMTGEVVMVDGGSAIVDVNGAAAGDIGGKWNKDRQ
jgi:meso-butanediol dehydrogenase / (S,S)-butanediol dehydrogenase / diacetyl reductase